MFEKYVQCTYMHCNLFLKLSIKLYTWFRQCCECWRTGINILRCATCKISKRLRQYLSTLCPVLGTGIYGGSSSLPKSGSFSSWKEEAGAKALGARQTKPCGSMFRHEVLTKPNHVEACLDTWHSRHETCPWRCWTFSSASVLANIAKVGTLFEIIIN